MKKGSRSEAKEAKNKNNGMMEYWKDGRKERYEFLSNPLRLTTYAQRVEKMCVEEQDSSNYCAQHVRDDVCELGVSCWQINLNQFDTKTYAPCNDNRQKKESKI